MANPSGHNVRFAVKRPPETSDYGTDATNPTDIVPAMSEGLTKTPELDQDESLTGQAGAGDSSAVAWKHGGTLPCTMYYQGLEYLLLAALGFENPTVYTGDFGSGSGGSPAPDSAASPTCYTHLFECDDDLHRTPWQAGERTASSGGSTDPTYWTASDQKVRSVSLAIDKPVPSDAVHHFTECMVRKATFNLTRTKMSVDFDLLPRELKKDSTLNRDNWALSSTARALFSGLTLEIGAIGSSLGSSLPIQEASIDLDNSLVEEYASGTDADLPIEPIRGDGGRKITGKLKIGRYSSSQWDDWMEDEDELQAVITATGSAIPGSTEAFEFKLIMPKLKVKKAHFPVAGPGVITGDIEFTLEKPDSTQAWLSTLLGGITQVKNNEFLIRLRNDRAACFSRDRQASGVTLP